MESPTFTPAESDPAGDEGLLRAVEQLELLVWRLRDRIWGYETVRRSHQRVIETLNRSLLEAQRSAARNVAVADQQGKIDGI